jgi:integrase
MPPRTRNRLTVARVRSLKLPGRYADGGNLYAFLSSNGARVWVFRYRDRTTGKHRDKSLGPIADVSLERARAKAAECRAQLIDRIDPINAGRAQRDADRAASAKRMTFGECAAEFIADNSAAWRNAKHRAQWKATLETYCAELNTLPVALIDKGHVLRSLKPIWEAKTETATRVRQRIETVLDWAAARDYRTGDNPARWRGHLDKLLPKPAKLKSVEHHPALPYTEIGAFMNDLRLRDALAARVLELQILTATRPGEVAGALWTEFDIERATWTIPPTRMKSHREHRVPLSDEAIALLKALPQTGPYVFPGLARKGSKAKSITTMAALSLLKELRPGLTAHGFRSTFRDWAADQTAYPRDVAEAALAHVLKDKSEAAYRRTDLFDKRSRLMAEWARYTNSPARPTNLVPISAGNTQG